MSEEHKCLRCGTPFTPRLLKGINKMSNHCDPCGARNILDGLGLPTPPILLDEHTKHPTLTDEEFYRDLKKPAPLLAWEVWVNDWHMIAFAATKPKARYQAVKAYWEKFGRRHGVWPPVIINRAELYDGRIDDKSYDRVFNESEL